MMNQKGGYDVNFVDTISDHLTCVICQLALKNPVLLVDCGHRFCGSCYMDMKDDAVQRNADLLCPHDRMKVDVNKVVEDKGMSRMIRDLKVTCKYVTGGCEWIGDLSNLEHHLSRDCTFEEKEKTIKLLENVQNRLELCETRLQENEKELVVLKTDNQQKDDEISMMKQHIISLEVNFEQFQTVQKQVVSDASQEIEATAASLSPSVKSKSDEQVSSTAKKTNVSWETSSDILRHNEMLNDISKQVKTLEENMKVIEQLTANKEVVFKWKLENYSYYKEIGRVSSPKFYSRMNGHCCMISLLWLGNKKEKLGLYFQLCRGSKGETVNDEVFSYEVNLEMHGKDGATEHMVILPSEFANKSYFVVHHGEDRSNGMGREDFLNMPQLKDFVISNSVSITCTLIPK